MNGYIALFNVVSQTSGIVVDMDIRFSMNVIFRRKTRITLHIQ